MTNTMRLTAGLCTLLILGACGDNSATDTVAPTGSASVPEPQPTPTSRLFFTSGDTTLSAVNPADGSVSVAAAGTKISGVATILHGDYDATRKRLSRLHQHTVVYANGTHLWKLSALSADNLSPTRLGAEATIGAAGVCQTFVAPDYANPQHSRYAYQLPGMDDSCGTPNDNVWKLLRLDHDTDTAPIVSTGNIDRPLAIVRDVSTGALTGWLRVIGTSLVRFDADFRYAVTVRTLPAAPTYVANLNDGRIALMLGKNVTLYDPTSYPLAGSGLSAPLYTFANSPGRTVTDGEHLYVVDGSNIVEVPLTANAPATIIATIDAASSIEALALTPTRLVYVNNQTVNAGTPAETAVLTLRSVARIGGTQLILATAQVGEFLRTTGNGALITVGEWIYYNRGTGFPFDPANFFSNAGVVRADGSSRTEYPQAHWNGWQHADSAPLHAPRIPGRMLLFDSSTTPATLWAFDSAARRMPGSLGTAPSGIYPMYFTGYGSGSALLGRGQNTNYVDDVFYIDMQKAGSLKRLTDTATEQDAVVGGGCTIARSARPDASLALILVVLAGAFVRRALARRAIKKSVQPVTTRS